MVAGGARCGDGMRTSRSAAVATLGLALIGGCGGSGPDSTSDAPALTTDPAPATSIVASTGTSSVASTGTSSATSTGTSSATSTGTSSVTSTGTSTGGAADPDPTGEVGTSPSASDETTIGFDELRDAPDDLIGRSFRVVVRAFFVEQCPPPGTTPAAPCSLSLFVTEPERDHLVYADRTTAIPVFDAAGRVSCQVGDGVTTACAGWTQAALYELIGSAKRTATAPGIELHITDAHPLAEGSARPTPRRQPDDRRSARPMPEEPTRR
jgi:hypothetical protein